VEERRGIVLFGGVVGPGKVPAESAAWLRDLVADLDTAYGDERLAPFGFTQGEELAGLLAPSADPLIAVLRAALDPAAFEMRWVCVGGEVDPGEGPATQRTGGAFPAARAAVEEARAGHDRLLIRTGRADADELLDGMAPALMHLLEGLTKRQRAVARLALIEGLRQSEVAERLGVRRATISVSFGRSDVAAIGRLVTAMRSVYSAAVAGSASAASAADATTATA
jgi:hypothetical protein